MLPVQVRPLDPETGENREILTGFLFYLFFSSIENAWPTREKVQRASEREYAWYPLRRSLFSLSFSHDLRHEIAHLFRSTFLHLPCDVGVGSQCESCVEMTEHT